MTEKKAIHKAVGTRWNQEELAYLEWLAKETSRTQSGAIKWAVAKVAKEMGYTPKK